MHSTQPACHRQVIFILMTVVTLLIATGRSAVAEDTPADVRPPAPDSYCVSSPDNNDPENPPSPFLYQPFAVKAKTDLAAVWSSQMDHQSPEYSADGKLAALGEQLTSAKNRTKKSSGLTAYESPSIESFIYYDGHDGNDFAVAGNALAAAPGTVAFVGNYSNLLGRVVEIYHPEGYLTRYAHLAEVSVTEGDKITAAGTPIGKIGGSGFSNGAIVDGYWGTHLHFSVFRWNDKAERWEITDPFGWDPWQGPSGQTSDPLKKCNGEVSYDLWIDGFPTAASGPSVTAGRPTQGRYVGGWIGGEAYEPRHAAASDEYLAFIRDGDAWLLDAQTGVETKLRDDGAVSSLGWTNDGQALAYSSGRLGNAEIYIVDLADGSSQRITESQTDELLPAFAPGDPDVLYFARVIDPHTENVIMAHDLRNGDEWMVSEPSFGPCDPAGLSVMDANRLLYTQWCGTGAGIGQLAYIFELSTGEQTDLGNYYGVASSPEREQLCPGDAHGIVHADWSSSASSAALVDTPDCFDMVFGNDFDGPETLVILDFGGPTVRSSIVTDENGIVEVDWSADGQRLAYSTQDAQIWAIGTDGGSKQLLVSNGVAPAWRPQTSMDESPRVSQNIAPAVEQTVDEMDPVETALAYYAELQYGMQTGDFGPAYELLSKGRQAGRSVETLRDTYNDSILATVEQVDLLSEDGDSAFVHLIVALTAVNGDITRYDTTYELVHEAEGWRLHKPVIKELP